MSTPAPSTTAVATVDTHHQPVSPFSGQDAFTAAQRMAKALCSSDLVPEIYRGDGKIGNALIALELSHRIGASVLMVMQHMTPIHGKPAWSSTFLIAGINSSKRFSPLRYQLRDVGEIDVGGKKVKDRACIAWAVDLETQERLESPEVSIGMAVSEGWYTRNGSKWKNMSELMLRYRAAAFFARLYAPEVTMGMRTIEEEGDIPTLDTTPALPVNRPRLATAEVVPTAGEVDPGELQSWAEDNEVTFGEVVGWLKPVVKPASWTDLTPDEVAHAMKNRDAMKAAVEADRTA